MADLSDYFCGVADVSGYSQVVALEMIPVLKTVTDTSTGETSTVVQNYTRNLYTADYTTTTFVFEGVPVSVMKSLPTSVTVTDIDGVNHTVSLKSKVVDGSSGSTVFEKETNTVNTHRMSPHLRRIEVVHRVGTLYKNGVKVDT